jgi:predicted PurR-regulated permease PerM
MLGRAPSYSPNLYAAIRIGFVALLAYWSLKVISPFLTIALWSAIITIALYPAFEGLARLLGNRRSAAMLMTAMCLMIVIGPVAWIGSGLIGGVDLAVKGIDAKIISIPLPAESVKDWPLVGGQIHHLWTLAANDIKATLVEVAPRLKPLGSNPWCSVSWNSLPRFLSLVSCILQVPFSSASSAAFCAWFSATEARK